MATTSVCSQCEHCWKRANYKKYFSGVIPIPFIGWLGGEHDYIYSYSYFCDVWGYTHPVSGKRYMARCGKHANKDGKCKEFEAGEMQKLEPVYV